jgi:hypothetical protein
MRLRGTVQAFQGQVLSVLTESDATVTGAVYGTFSPIALVAEKDGVKPPM